MRALHVSALGLTLALTGCGETCDEGGLDVPASGSVSDPFAEVNGQGLTAYLGTVEPSEVSESGAETYFAFDRASGPICLRGGEYWMSTRAGDPARLVIYQRGGGACWSEQCSASSSAGDREVPTSGLLNPELEANALADWSVAYLPYCDGSLFVGDAEIDENGDGQIDRHHRGLLNLSASLDVAHARFPDAERIILAGSSAGAYGVHLSNMLVRALWPDAEIIVVADSGLGIGRPGDLEFIPGLLEEWNAAHLIPQSCSDCVTDHITGLVDWELERDPNMRFAVISSYDDALISETFLELEPGVYATALRDELGRLASAHPDRYHRFLFDGELHSTITTDSQHGSALLGVIGSYDEVTVGKVSVADWLAALVHGCSSFRERLE